MSDNNFVRAWGGDIVKAIDYSVYGPSGATYTLEQLEAIRDGMKRPAYSGPGPVIIGRFVAEPEDEPREALPAVTIRELDL